MNNVQINVEGIAKEDLLRDATFIIKINEVHYNSASDEFSAVAEVASADPLTEIRAGLEDGDIPGWVGILAQLGLAMADGIRAQTVHLERIDDALRNTIGGSSRY